MFADKIERSFNINHVILLLFLTFSIGLVKLTWLFSKCISTHINLQNTINQMCSWIAIFPHQKLPSLLHFILSVAALGIWYAIYFFAIFLIKKNGVAPALKNKSMVVTIIFIAVLFNLIFLTLPIFYLQLASCWMALFISLIYILCQHTLQQIDLKGKLLEKSCWVLTGIVSFIFLIVFYPLILKPMLIANEFFDIPEQSILKSGQIVDNTQYTNTHNIGGLQTYDPRTDGGVLLYTPELPKVSVASNPMFIHFLKSSINNNFFYNYNTKILSVKGVMSLKQYHTLNQIFKEDPISLEAINQLFDLAYQNNQFYKKRIYTSEEQEFISINKYEFATKAKAGWFFFHHSWVLNPVLAIAMGVDSKQETLIYGWGVARFLQTIMMHWNGINFQNYFQLMFAFYPIYFLMFLLTIWFIFHKSHYLLIGSILFSSSIFTLGDTFIRLAPGYNPIRHMFDMIIIFLFFLYTKKNHFGYLLSCLLCCLVSIVWSKDFGLFILLAVSATGIIKFIFEPKKPYYPIPIILITVVIAFFLYCASFQGINYNLIYMLLGYTMPGSSSPISCIFLLSFSICYALYIEFRNIHSAIYWVSLCLFFYSQLQVIYYIWNPSYHHLLVISPTLILLVLTWGSMYFSLIKHNGKKEVTFKRLPCAILLGVYVVCLLSFYQGRLAYEKIFTTHLVYDWTFDHANFQSTMDPTLFKETIPLIHRYAPGSNMYMISKYDAILPILVNRFNALPVVNLALDLMSQRDINRCIQKIKADNPRYLFADTDIIRDMRGDIFAESDSLGKPDHYRESYGRFSAVLNMRQLFYLLKDDYRPIDIGRLITVYEKRHSNEN